MTQTIGKGETDLFNKDETDAIGIKFVKTEDRAFRKKFGIEELPTIVYFEDKQPSIYDGKNIQSHCSNHFLSIT